jgi:drug/metabolite transporter (DMT)-like permease
MKANQKSLMRDERGEGNVAGIGLILIGIFIILGAPQISDIISDWQKATSVPEDSQWQDLQLKKPMPPLIIRVFGICLIIVGVMLLFKSFLP